MNTLLIVLFIIAFFIIAALTLYNLAKAGDKLHQEFKSIRDEALAIKTEEDLQRVFNRAVDWNSKLFHRSQNSMSAELRGILSAKIKELNLCQSPTE